MFRGFSLAAAIAAFALAVLGSWIRINGAGMTCPDWPLCHGAVVPVLDGGVVLEWSHRMLAFVIGFLLIGVFITGWRARHEVRWVKPLLAALAVVFVTQVGLGGATVALANSPWSVVLHWAAAMLLIATLVSITIVALVRPPIVAGRPAQGSLFGLLVATAATAYVAMCAGAYVSSSGAGLACATLPDCNGSWWPANAAQLAQMTHRFAAAACFLLATVAAYRAAFRTTVRVRIATLTGYSLIVGQIMLGMANIAWLLPHGLREAHAANAAATFVAFIGALVFATIDGTVRAGSQARAATTGSVARA